MSKQGWREAEMTQVRPSSLEGDRVRSLPGPHPKLPLPVGPLASGPVLRPGGAPVLQIQPSAQPKSRSLKEDPHPLAPLQWNAATPLPCPVLSLLEPTSPVLGRK